MKMQCPICGAATPSGFCPETCSEVVRTGKSVERLVREDSRIPDDRMSFFHTADRNFVGKYARRFTHE